MEYIKKTDLDIQLENLQKVLFDNKEASNSETIANAMIAIEYLSKRNADIKILLIKCSFCGENLQCFEQDVVVYEQCKQKQNSSLYFHEKCIVDYANSYSLKTICKHPLCEQDNQLLLSKIMKQHDKLCQLCNVSFRQDQSQTINTGCQCPTKQVHLQCVKNYIYRCVGPYYKIKCNDCDQFFRRKTIMKILQGEYFGCIKCYGQNNNHEFRNSMMVECPPYFICRSCFDFAISRVDLYTTQVNQIKCFHNQDCQKTLSFNTLHHYFYGSRDASNTVKSDQILNQYQINLQNSFHATKCPGFLKITKGKSDEYTFLRQDLITHLIQESEKYQLFQQGNNQQDDEEYMQNKLREIIKQWDNDEEGAFLSGKIIQKCNEEFEINPNDKQVRCNNCNYLFCPICHIAHHNIPCNYYQDIKTNTIFKDDDLDLGLNEYGSTCFDQESIFADLQLPANVFKNKPKSRNITFDDYLKYQNQTYEYNLPKNYIYVLPINVKYLYQQSRSQFKSWLITYLPIRSIAQLRQLITCGIERNLPAEFIGKIDAHDSHSILYGRVMYSFYEQALEKSIPITLNNKQTVKVILLCRSLQKQIQQPSSHKNVYVATQFDNIAFQVIVFNTN